MREEAIRLQGIASEKIRQIGSIRYNAVRGEIRLGREDFLRACGLDPAKRTILFAGPLGEYHYFEMFEAFKQLTAGGGVYQLILRVYPDKGLMASPYIQPIIQYAKSLPNVYVSLSDPHYRTGVKNMEVPQIEQDDLWHALEHCDVVVNHFSTMGLEACLFDKPVVYLLYSPTHAYTWIQPPVYFDHGLAIHNRRMLAYGVARTAANREELIEAIKEAIAQPEKFAEQRREVVRQEFGATGWPGGPALGRRLP